MVVIFFLAYLSNSYLLIWGDKNQINCPQLCIILPSDYPNLKFFLKSSNVKLPQLNVVNICNLLQLNTVCITWCFLS